MLVVDDLSSSGPIEAWIRSARWTDPEENVKEGDRLCNFMRMAIRSAYK